MAESIPLAHVKYAVCYCSVLSLYQAEFASLS